MTEVKLTAILDQLESLEDETTATQRELKGLLRLMREQGFTQVELAELVGKDQSWISRQLSMEGMECSPL